MTGSALPVASIAAFARRLPEVHIVLDQSFSSLSEVHADAALRLPAHVVCVRSLTKDHGIPGVRVGYAIATAELCAAVEASRPAWTTSAFAQAAALTSCDCQSFVAESREQLRSRTLTAMLYPVLLFVVCVSIVAMLLTFVVPKIVKQFENSKAELPFLTQVLIAISDFLRSWGMLTLVVVILGFIGFFRWLRDPAARRRFTCRRPRGIAPSPRTGFVASRAPGSTASWPSGSTRLTAPASGR